MKFNQIFKLFLFIIYKLKRFLYPKRAIKIIMKKIWSWIITIIVFILIILFFSKNGDFFEILKNIELKYVLIVIVFEFLVSILNGLQIKYITQAYGKNLNVKEWFGLSVVNTMANHVTPFRGGLSIKAVYLKKIHDMPYTTSLTIIGAVMVLSVLVYSLLGAIVSVAYNLNMVVALVFFIVFLMMSFIIFLTPRISKTRYKYINYLIKSINKLSNLRKNYRLISMLFSLNLILLVMATFRIFYSFKALSFDIALTSCFVITLFTALSRIVSITPANLGITESITMISAKGLGVASKIGLSAALVERVATVIFYFTIGPIFSYVLSRQRKQ